MEAKNSCCSECNKKVSKLYPNNLCQSCYNYFRKGGTINETPKHGEIARDARGFVICHICGRAYRRLGSHIRESHGLTIANYKEMFGLCNNAKTTECSYSQHMRNLAYCNDMPQRLKETGQATRIKKGDGSLRLGKKSRLQECLERSKRYKGGR